MAGGYEVPKEGIEALRAWLSRLDRQVNELRGAAGVKSAVITDPNSTARIMLADGQIRIWDDYAANPEGYGLIYTDADGGANLTRIFPPHNSGTGLENSVTMRGTAPGTPGAFWMYTDGDALLQSLLATFIKADGNVVVDAGDRFFVDATNSIDLNAPKIRLYGMSTTGAAPNLALEVIDGEPILKIVTSSERGKTDIAPIEVEVDEVLAYRGITWIHNDTLEASATGDVRRNVGHHAEAMDQFPTLRQFVNYDDDGLPASVQEGRFEVALLEVVKKLWQRVTDHDARLTALESK